jgi:hypothetical protein
VLASLAPPVARIGRHHTPMLACRPHWPPSYPDGSRDAEEASSVGCVACGDSSPALTPHWDLTPLQQDLRNELELMDAEEDGGEVKSEHGTDYRVPGA